MLELFGYYLQRGLVDVGFLGAAQIDRFGNINTTVIGDYAHPGTRLPGSGGACEIAINARQRVRDHAPVEALLRGAYRLPDLARQPRRRRAMPQRIRREQGWTGSGPSVVVTDLGIYHFGVDGEMRLDSVHPGVTLDTVRGSMGWALAVADDLRTTPDPTAEELRLIREELDPGGRLHPLNDRTGPTRTILPRPDRTTGWAQEAVAGRHHLHMASEHVATDPITPAVPLWRVPDDEPGTNRATPVRRTHRARPSPWPSIPRPGSRDQAKARRLARRPSSRP